MNLAKRSPIGFAGRMLRSCSTLLALTMCATPAIARDSLGVFGSWGAFRDPGEPRCYAIAEPVRHNGNGSWRPFASIGHWPRQGLRGQAHFRLSRQLRPGATVTLLVEDRRFTLVSGGADAWSADKRMDAAVVAAIRSGTSMSVAAIDRAGRPFADIYALRGAATAIDAAALGCARA
jgi:hypothetical protein